MASYPPETAGMQQICRERMGQKTLWQQRSLRVSSGCNRNMSILKKLGAVALGTASLAGGAITLIAKETLEKAGNIAGSDGFTGSNGRTYTKDDYNNLAKKCNNDIFKKGLKKAVDLWNDDF